MNALIDSVPVASVITIILAIVGGCVVIFGHGLTFNQYLVAMAPLVGLTAIGRGIHKNGKG